MDQNISRHGVQRILAKFQQHTTLEELQKSGRPRRNDDRCERLLIHDARCHQKKLIGDEVNQLQCQLSREFSLNSACWTNCSQEAIFK